GTTFAIAPGHRSQGNVVEDRETYFVVRKQGDGGDVARARDPSSVREYEGVRADPLCYIIVPGHELPELESVVESGNGYDIVQKGHDRAAALAEETDPGS